MYMHLSWCRISENFYVGRCQVSDFFWHHPGNYHEVTVRLRQGANECLTQAMRARFILPNSNVLCTFSCFSAYCPFTIANIETRYRLLVYMSGLLNETLHISCVQNTFGPPQDLRLSKTVNYSCFEQCSCSVLQ